MSGFLSDMFAPDSAAVIDDVLSGAIGDADARTAWTVATGRINGREIDDVVLAITAMLAEARVDDVNAAESVAVITAFALPHATGSVDFAAA